LISFNKTGKITVSDRTGKRIIMKDLDGNFSSNLTYDKTNKELLVLNENGSLFILNLKGNQQKLTFKKSKKKMVGGFVNYSGDETLEFVRIEDSRIKVFDKKDKFKTPIKEVHLDETIDKIIDGKSLNFKGIVALSNQKNRLLVFDNQLNLIKKVNLPKSKNLFFDLDESISRIIQIEGKSLSIFSLD
jgi:hypothetical protein